MQHFCGGMVHWDPAVTDGFAGSRPVILFDNAGVARREWNRDVMVPTIIRSFFRRTSQSSAHSVKESCYPFDQGDLLPLQHRRFLVHSFREYVRLQGAF
jgi:hypothetical protein